MVNGPEVEVSLSHIERRKDDIRRWLQTFGVVASSLNAPPLRKLLGY